MIVKRYGITLSRLTQADIEDVRKARNSEAIRQFMYYRDEITPEMQKAWFQSVNNDNNLFFVIEYNGEKVGLINARKIDWDRKTDVGGIFLWEEKYWESLVPCLAALAFIDFGFLILGIETAYVSVLKENVRAIKFNEQLGYELLPTEDGKFLQVSALTKDRYQTKTAKLRRTAAELYGSQTKIILESFDDPNSLIVRKIKSIPAAVKEELEITITDTANL